MKGAQPDYLLWAAAGDRRGIIGAAWVNEDESLTIKLNVCVVLDANVDMTLKLYKNTQKSKKRETQYEQPQEDIPF